MWGRRDSFLAVGLGVLAFVWYLVFAPSGIPPEMWGEVAVASGLRAPNTVFPGLARYFAFSFFNTFDYATACGAIGIFGKLLTAMSAAFGYLILRYVLHSAATPLEIGTPKRRLAGEVICLVVATMYAVSEPMLITSEALSVDSLALFLSLSALVMFFRFLDRGGVITGGLMLFLFGVMTAETPSGFLLAGVAAVVYLLAVRGKTGFVPRPPSEYIFQVFKWWATQAFALGFLGTTALNITMFARHGGLEANGIDLGTAIIRYVMRYGEICAETATAPGWFMMLGMVVFPFMLVMALMPKAKNDEKFLKLATGLSYVFTGVIAAMQLGSVSILWFRSWTSGPCIHSHYLVNLCNLLSAITLVLAMAVLTIEAYFRNYRQIVRFQTEEFLPVETGFAGIRRRRVAMAVAIPLGLILFALPFSRYSTRRSMRMMLDEGIEEITREIGGAKRVFTDGTLDDGIEIAMKALHGRAVYPMAMLGEPGNYAEYLRTRGGLEGEDLHSAKMSSASAFHDWVLYRPERVAESAFMLGFEMWIASGKTQPAGSGFLVRTEYGEGERERGIEAAKELGGRILGFCAEHPAAEREAAGPLLNRFFTTVAWRISRLAVLRADAADRDGDKVCSAEEREFSRKLDEVNPFLADIRKVTESMVGRPRGQVSMRERLKLALMRADFPNAAICARSVLQSDPDNVDAHFAIGMHNYFSKNYAVAEIHLEKALDANPKDGAIWNNLAMCQLRLKNYKAAENSALEATRRLPGSTAASNTLIEIRKAIEEEKI